MGSVKIEKLGGMLPAWDDRFLPDNQAAFARNTFLYSGAGIGWRMPKLLRALTNSAAKYAYRVPTTSQAIAAANLLFKTNVIAGDTVTLGEIIYTFRASPSAQYDVLLGADVLTSARALFTAACFGPYDTAVVGAGTPANPAIASDVPYFGFPFSFNSPGNNTQPANSIILVPFTAPATMQVTAINCVPQTSNASAKFTGVVYENVYTLNAAGTAYQNTPTSLSATGAQVVGCTAGSTLTSTLATPITLQQGSVYWFGFIIDSAIAFTKASTSTLGVSNTNTYSGGPPNPFQQTTISGATVAGTSVGTLQTTYNQNQPTWQIWGSMAALQTLDAENTIGTVTFASVQYNYLGFQAPSFGASFNQTPVAESTAGARVSWLADLASVNDTTAFFVGGVNQTLDATPTGAGTWLEFLDQDTNVVRTPVVGDSWQRYYYASPSLPPQYNTAARIAAGSPSWILGVPAPPNAPTLSTLSGGNPTQIGFPNSANSQSLNLPANTLFNSLLVLYPVRSTSAQQLNDVAIQLNALTGSDSIEMQAVLFQDASATGGTANTPGDLIAFGGIVQAVASGFTPGPLTSFFSVGPTLLANTLYWMGAIIWVVGNSAKVGLGDNFSQGSSANLGNSLGNDPSSPTGMGFTKNPKTGFFQAPAMSANYPDLQLWGDFVANAGAAQEETRAYAYTWVTAYGEEGPPSPPALLTAFDNATWTVGLQPPLAEDMGTLRNIVRTNIYRTMASVQGGTVYFYVGTVTATATTFVDHITDDVVSLNSILPSTTWYGPPATLQGLISMPNGMIAGFRANEVWFCEPFRPHAWPAQYVMTTDYPIVGLGVVGTALVACTDTVPYVFSGISPIKMTSKKIAFPEPCLSRGAIFSTDSGVVYPSVNGLNRITEAGVPMNMTQAWITREKWNRYVPQRNLRASKNTSSYFCFSCTNGADVALAQTGFSLEISDAADKTSFSIWPQVGGHRIGFSTLTAPGQKNVDNVLTDPWNGVTELIYNGSIYYYDFTDQAPTIQPYLWRSKKFQGPHKDNFSAFRVFFDLPPGGPQTPPVNRTVVAPFNVDEFEATVTVTPLMTFKTGMLGIVRILADDKYIVEREIRNSEELMRIPSYARYSTWQLEVEGVVSVTNIKMATSVKELGVMK